MSGRTRDWWHQRNLECDETDADQRFAEAELPRLTVAKVGGFGSCQDYIDTEVEREAFRKRKSARMRGNRHGGSSMGLARLVFSKNSK